MMILFSKPVSTGFFSLYKNIFGLYLSYIYICEMKAVIIHLDEEVLSILRRYAIKKGWNRKQYMEWQLTYHTKINTSREEARKNKSK